MNSITKFDHLDNMGGIVKLWYVPISDVTSMSRPIHDYGGVTLAANKEWLEMYFSPQSASVKIKFKNGSKGSYFECKLKGVIPKHYYDLNTRINQLCDYAFICKVLDANGEYRVIGTKDFPLRFSFEFDSGKKTADRNSVAFEFAVNAKYAPIFLTGAAGQQS